MAHGPERGLELIASIEGLADYHLFHAARADLLRRLERREAARGSYRVAIGLTTNPAERDYLERRLAALG